MNFTSIRIYCRGCGSPRDVTRRVRDKRCADCKKDDARKERRNRLADKLVERLKADGTPVIKTHVLRVLDVLHDHRRGVLADKQRARAGK